MVLDASLLKLSIIREGSRGKVEQPGERSSAPLQLGLVAIKKGAFRVTLDYGRHLYFTYLL